MKFEAEIDLNYRQLLALYQVSERLFRRWQMLLFRVVCLAVGVLRVWKTWGDIQAGGLSFTRVSYLLIGVLFLSAGADPQYHQRRLRPDAGDVQRQAALHRPGLLRGRRRENHPARL